MFVGKQADPAALEGIREKLGLDDPILVQFWRLLQGHLRRPRLRQRPATSSTARRPASATPSRPSRRSGRVLTDRLPVTLSLAIGAAVLWLIIGVARRRHLRAQAAARSWTAARWASPSAASRCRSTSPACSRWRIFSYELDLVRRNEYIPLRRASAPVVQRHDPALGHARLPLRARMYARLTRASMLEMMGEDYIRTARAKGLRERRSSSASTPCAPRMTPIITLFGMDLGAADRRRDPHRDHVHPATASARRGSRRSATNDLPIDPRRHPDRRLLRRRREPRGGPAVRRDRPPSEALMTDTRARPGPRPSGEPRHRRAARSRAFLEVRDLKVHFPTDDGLVKSVDGLSFQLEKGKTLGIVGESGSGKSVTSLGIMGLHRVGQYGRQKAQISGEIWLDGKELLGRRPGRGAPAARPRDGDDLPGPAVRAAPVLHDRQARSSRRTGSTTTSTRRPRASGPSRCSTGSASRSPTSGWTATRTSSPAVCASAR